MFLLNIQEILEMLILILKIVTPSKKILNDCGYS